MICSERGSPFMTLDCQADRTGRNPASFRFGARPYCCGIVCGYELADDGNYTLSLQVYLGHENIQHTVRYSELSPTRFKDFWR
jgi:hypothetical protein